MTTKQDKLDELIDNFGVKKLLADLIGQSHFVDIRVRLNGEYYWFEGDYLKQILPKLTYKQVDNDGIKTTLESCKQKANLRILNDDEVAINKRELLSIANTLLGDAMPDPYDERDTSPSWLSERMIKASDGIKEMLQASQQSEGE